MPAMTFRDPVCHGDNIGAVVWPVRLWLVRHGQTEWSLAGRHTGRTDVPLVPAGEAQAQALGARIAALVPEPALVLTSPRSRALDTCRLAGLGERAEVVEDLAEWDYGDYEGLTTPQIRETRPGWTLWTDGVPGGESAADVGRRADEVVRRARSADGDVVCFGHGHALRVLAARWVGLPPAGGRLWALETGSLSALDWEREVPVVARWNEPASPASPA